MKSAEIIVLNTPEVIAVEARFKEACPAAEGHLLAADRAIFQVRDECTKDTSGLIGSYIVYLSDGRLGPDPNDNDETIDSPRLRRIREKLLTKDCASSK